MSDVRIELPASLTQLPTDELWRYARDLGLLLEPGTGRSELLGAIRTRQELLGTLDREAMLDVVVWGRIPVRRSATKEQLARDIATLAPQRFSGLSDRGLRALALLRDAEVRDGDDRAAIEQRLRRRSGIWARLRRRRRAMMGSLLARVVDGAARDDAYRFLPEDEGSSLKETIEDVGVVGGIARKLRGAADSYVHEKLDEIERRIDRKLDEIDERLGAWRDREIRNRLRLVKITLITTIIVAAISLGYDYIKTRSRTVEADEASSAEVDEPPP